MSQGWLFVFEGIDGAGKSTQVRSLVRRLRARGLAAVPLREPTRGRYGREIRRLAKRRDSMTPAEELDLFLKDRREDVDRRIRPALAEGAAVVMDRYYFSTIAYQGAKGLSPSGIRRMNERFAPKPDLVFILDLPAASGLGRIRGRKARDLLFEREAYLRRVRRIFASFKGPRFVHLDASRDRSELAEEIFARALAVIAKRVRSIK